MKNADPETLFDRVTVVLHQPRSPENIGSAARAMWNMGLSRLVVVDPVSTDEIAMRKLATRKAAHILEALTIHETLEEALGPFNYIVGTTARVGGLRQSLKTPETAASRIVELGPENRIAVLFGPEDRGLTNHELRFCHMLVRIPTAEFSSLNVSQAVMILCYEIYKAESGAPERDSKPRLANAEELERMYDALREILVKISLIQPDNPEYWMMKVRQFLNRKGLLSRDTRMIRGLCRQIDWFGRKSRRDGGSECLKDEQKNEGTAL